MDRKIILFGCGIIGHEALERLGKDNVLCFCDNDISLHGTSRWGKDIVSLEYIKNNYSGFVILICARIDKAYHIACQLDENGIFNYWCYPIIEKDLQDCGSGRVLEFLYNKDLMVEKQIKLYRDKISKLEKQLDYMKIHSDIKTLKPATGALRKRQMELTDLGSFVSGALNEALNIKPFLYAGNLLGYVRHNGFIPWDDDLDFGLIRKEYGLLCRYCKEHQDDNGMVEFTFKNKKELLSFNETHESFALARCINGVPLLSTEFFSIDYYKEDYLFEDYKKDAQMIKINSCAFKTEEEKINYIREEIKKNKYVVEKSNLVFFGFDNMDSAILHNNGRMMPEKILFPLKNTEFEGKQFWIPNEPEEFLTYIYKDIWEFPEDAGIIKHNLASEE